MRSCGRLSILLIAAACARHTAAASGDAVPALAGAPGATYVATIAPMGVAAPPLTGTLTLQATSDTSFSVTVALRGARPNTRFLWTIRIGQCGERLSQNAEVAPPEAFPPIRVQPDGEARDRARLTLELPDEPLHVDLMFDDPRRENVVACGSLVRRS